MLRTKPIFHYLYNLDYSESLWTHDHIHSRKEQQLFLVLSFVDRIDKE